MKKHNRIDYIELPASGEKTCAAGRDFFAGVFGWTFKSWGEDYVDTADSGVGFGINGDDSHRAPAPLIVIYSNDLEKTRGQVADAGGVITRDIFSFPGGRRFHFREPGGNILAVWSDH